MDTGKSMKVAFVQLSTGGIMRGPGFVAASIIRAGHDLKLFDSYDTPIATITKQILRQDFDILMISSMTIDFHLAIDLIRRVKSKIQVPILFGGVHATLAGKQVLQEYPEIDYACIGEGESMVVDFLDHFGLSSLHQVHNLVYRHEGAVIANPVRPPEDLTKLPVFPWHFYKKNRVVPSDGFLYVTATRGCPYRCSYCSNAQYLEYYGTSYLRTRPLEQVKDELRYLHQTYQPRLFYFADEMMLSDFKYAEELFWMIKHEFNTPYGFMARVEHITPDLVKLATETGCKYVGMGVECGNEDFRKKVLNRRMSNQQIIEAFRLLKEADIFVTSYNMIGFPAANDAFLTEETIRLNQKLKPNFMQISIFYPFPGSFIYEQCISADLIDPEKARIATNYYDESILRGVSLRQRRQEIDTLFNPVRNWNQLFWKDVPRKTSGLVAWARRSSFFRRILPSPIKSVLKKWLSP
jgi:anaerobic magnesium-protoporphyrin IX monomethyl ester cyclase